VRKVVTAAKAKKKIQAPKPLSAEQQEDKELAGVIMRGDEIKRNDRQKAGFQAFQAGALPCIPGSKDLMC
jgi:hypothetical protein